MRLAFLTMDDTKGWFIDAELAFDPLRARGWIPQWVPWRRPDVDWNEFSAVYLASTWDYPDDPDGFLAVLEAVDASNAVLVNDIALVRWNLRKTYLRDLAKRGVDIVPGAWHDRFDDTAKASLLAFADGSEVIVKPVIGANACDTFLLRTPVPPAELARLNATFASRPFVIQPFVGSVQTKGETSLFYFAGRYSHAVRKLPKHGDFRVQEEHGGHVVAVEPSPALRRAGDFTLGTVDPLPVYARIDFVQDEAGRFLLMELELIEPSLYLSTHVAAPERLAGALDDYLRRHLKVRTADGPM